MPLVAGLAGMLLALTAAAILFQWLAGAYAGDFGGHPDEGAHFVTGLMVRDYVVSGFPQHPMRYAETYYAHYPKVALGHYPPAFYALEGAWLCVFPVGRMSVLVLMAVLSGGFGTTVFAIARQRAGALPAAVAAAVLAVALPLTQTMTSTVMSDLLVAALALLSARSFVRYMEGEKWIDSLAYGLLATAAVMTKASGLFLALLPPAAILLTGRYRLLARWSLWIAVLPVMLVCGPWLWFSSGITAEGMIDRGVLEHVRFALPYFAGQLPHVFGYSLLVPAVLGVAWIFRRRASQREVFWVVVFAMPVCLVAFYSAIPAGLEPRYLLPAVPAVLLLAIAGLRWAVSRVPDRRRSVAAWGLGLLVAGLFLLETFSIPKTDFTGYRASVRELVDLAGRRKPVLKLLVSADARGEGAFISEVAILDERRPSHTVDRSSKVLSESDWLGRGYREAFESDEQLLSFLVESGYDGIFVDETIPEILLRTDHTRLARVLNASDKFTRISDLPVPAVAPDGRGSGNVVFVPAAAGP